MKPLPRAQKSADDNHRRLYHSKCQTLFLLFNCVFFLALIYVPVFCQDTTDSEVESKLNQWFQLQTKASAYKTIHRDLLAEIKKLATHDITTEYLFEKLNQGLSKSAPPEQLLLAIKEDVQRLIQAKSIIQMLGQNEGVLIKQANIKSLSIYIQAGLSMDFFNILLHDYPLFTPIHQTNTDEFTARINQFLLLCEAMVKIGRASQNNHEELARLALAIVKSPIEPKAYETLASMYTRAKLNHLSDTIIMSTMIEILENKGGIIEITDQLNRRMKYR
ncbi:MAG: hypothetical protein JXR70_12145 [Spirochaetales bacterium]|nr:hypothetical protein [Spirochaetales bacterium]